MENELNYQKSSLKIKCKGCTDTCELIYDRHHDQTYSITCGRVVMQSNNIIIDYPANPLFWQQQKQRRDQIKQLKKIIAKLKELEINYTTNDEPGIIIPELTHRQELIINNLCEETDFKLILEKKFNPEKEYLGSQYHIKKRKGVKNSGATENTNRTKQKIK